MEAITPLPRRFALGRTELAELVVQRGEGQFTSSGAIAVNTGVRTGRSPRDRFIVRDRTTQFAVDWGAVNQDISPELFERLWQRVESYLSDKDGFTCDLHVGSHPDHYLPIHVTTEYAWHALFARSMFIEPTEFNPGDQDIWEILSAPDFVCLPDRDGTRSEAAVMIDFTDKRVLLAGLKYGGELKKAMFAVQNFVLPEADVLPMHCSANVDSDGQVALFFGLSGTGKTTLSADPDCQLIGDDEHGWGPGTVFNFEGGCYAKCINLTRDAEPVIFDAIRFGAIVENVVVDQDSREPDYEDSTYTENTRACFPLDNIATRIEENRAGEPNVIVFLTCDVSGVLPPVAKLSKEAAAYHFLSGYTAKVGSTEVGSTEDYTATFSACFGAPFFPRRAGVYADLLMRRIEAFGTKVFLVNTGWTGGGVHSGKRFSIPVTRAVIRAIRSGLLDTVETERLEGLNLEIPVHVEGVDANVLNPRRSWQDQAAYDRAAAGLIAKFTTNFTQFDVDSGIVEAGPA